MQFVGGGGRLACLSKHTSSTLCSSLSCLRAGLDAARQLSNKQTALFICVICTIRSSSLEGFNIVATSLYTGKTCPTCCELKKQKDKAV